MIAKVGKDKSYKTLQSHTEDLLTELERIKSLYPEIFDEKLYFALKVACLFHDLGKISYHFQKKIHKVLGKEFKENPEGRTLKKDIPHNFLSGVFLFSLEVYKKLENEIGKELFDAVFFAVSFHHDRKIDFSQEDFKKTLEYLSQKISLLEWLKNYGFEIKSDIKDYGGIFSEIQNLASEKINLKNKNRILIKGLLHRIDHSASAEVEVEREPIDDYTDRFNKYLNDKNITLRNFQQQAKELSDRNVLLVASTGLGKTEFAMNWINGEKAFYTLPVRVSVNAMYERFKSAFGDENIGLLHSFAKFYEIERNEDDNGIETGLDKIDMSRLLAMPITVTTADQLFTSVFKYPGFEKIYATLSYSKVIIDEPQGYSPETLAYIVKGIRELKDLGAKFLVMTATLHPFLKKEINGFELIEEFSKVKKHKIKLEDKKLEELSEDIIESYNQGKKVLVITNTVKKSQQIYQLLKDKANVKLLHSLFIQKEKSKKEKEIQNEKGPVIWISTQIVEASLDIDYDILFTELSSIDSLIQRMGRIYRGNGREIKDEDKPNVIVATNEPSGKGNVYDSAIVDRTLESLTKFNEKVMTEEIKQEIMGKVYLKEEIPEFYNKFKKSMELLELGFQSSDKNEAEKLFRRIYNYTVIPESIYKEKFTEIEGLINTVFESKSQKDKLFALKEIYDYTLQLPIYRVNSVISKTNINGIYTVNINYDEELGLNLLSQECKDIGEFI
ncbi:MAG: CRISPR-associated helicase Cas3' [Hydrogenothermaceae bacterium]|nr:CRISPR-associated helicase Cas3' [Hydrogenothermaceae bacterium]